jgi:putative hydrolase of the HAD superfamily
VIRGVLFDLFGTLVPNFTNTQVDRLLSDLAMALDVDQVRFAQCWKDSFTDRVTGNPDTLEKMFDEYARISGGSPAKAQIDHAVQIRVPFSRESIVSRHDAIETLIELKRRGFSTGLLSNCSHEVPLLWPDTQFASLIHHPHFSCKERLRKPWPEFFERALASMELRPEECLYVADGDLGEMAGAKAVGMKGVLIRDRDENGEVFRADEEVWDGQTIENLSELLSMTELSGRTP